jgi:CubicO group peptidase (beta-lactamase class C family)
MIRKSRTALFFCVLLLTAVPAAAQELPTAKPESAGFSADQRISKAVQRGIDDKRIAGAVTLVMRHGQAAFFKAQGMQDRKNNRTMRTDTIFRICSMSKPITSAAVMILYEEGYFKGLNRFPDTPITGGSFIYSADYPYHGPKKFFSGGAGLNSTAADYARFCQMMLEGGKLGTSGSRAANRWS